MGLYANYPIALAPGMGLNAYFAYTVVIGMGYTWQAALGAVCISGILFLIISVLHIREMIINGIPRSMRIAITAGIGLFLGIIVLKNAGIVSAPPSIDPTLFELDLSAALSIGILNVVLVFFLVELFDATGTLMGVASRAGLLKTGKMERMNKALIADSTAIVGGAFLGTSSTTAYIESAAGVQAGGRTGLTALAVAVLFLACLFIAPLAGAVPAYATAPALFYVACLMLRDLADVEWEDSTESVPAVITALLMPFTFSIANGVAFGFISYAGLKLFTGRAKEVPVIVWIIAAIFVLRYIYPGAE